MLIRTKKKIALLTWASDENYGTALQCFALINIIQRNFSCTCIDYSSCCKGFWKNFRRAPVHTFFQGCRNRIKRLFGLSPLAYKTQENRHVRFVDFREHYFAFTEKMSDYNALVKLDGTFSALVCGSDQIWNPFLFDAHYFLDFVSDNKKKIAYAPSFGTENIDSSENAIKIPLLVKDFAFLSCREESGAAWLREKTGRTVPAVLDPTLLLQKEEWKKIANEEYNVPNHYILCYFLGRNESYWNAVQIFAKQRELPLVILPIFKNDFSRKAFVPDDIGPSEFVRLVANADFICTDSFHGCCFSVLFEKEFAAFLRFSKKDKKSQNARVCDFLEKFHLQKRLLTDEKTLDVIFSETIDYNGVYDILDGERKKSLDYLSNALSVVTSGGSNV